jgi:hypothetical protein
MPAKHRLAYKALLRRGALKKAASIVHHLANQQMGIPFLQIQKSNKQGFVFETVLMIWKTPSESQLAHPETTK